MKTRFSISEHSHRKAHNIAQILLSRFRNYKGFGNPRIHTIYPLLGPDGAKDVFFEVKLTSQENMDHGYVIVSLSEDYFPVMKFAMRGKTHLEKLVAKVGHWEFNPVFFTPFYLVAENDKGDLLAETGNSPIPFRKRGKERKRKPISYRSFKRGFLRHREQFLKNKQKDCEKAWEILKKIGQATKSQEDYEEDFLYEDDLSPGNYNTITAYHHLSFPRYKQIQPNTGANDQDFWSGCTACAWMCLIGYHDNTMTPDLLRGSHLSNKPSQDDYPGRVMVQLSKHLGTYDAWCVAGPGGVVSDDDTVKGYSFITDKLGHEIKTHYVYAGQIHPQVPAFTEDGGMDSFNLILNYLYLGRPSLITIPGHALNAYEARVNQDPSVDDHYLKIYDGWDGQSLYQTSNGNWTLDPYQDYLNDPFIPYGMLDSAYSLMEVVTRNRVRFNRRSASRPATAEFDGRLVIAYRKVDNDSSNFSIGLIFSADGRSIESERFFAAVGNGAPSIAAEPSGKYLYIAWLDHLNHKIRIVKTGIDSEIVELPSPGIDANENPSIVVHKGSLYLAWQDNILYTPLDLLERSAVPWPNEVGPGVIGNGWMTLGTWRHTLSMATDGLYFYLSSGDGRVMVLDLEGRLMQCGGYDWFHTGDLAGPHLCYFNRTLYACNGYKIYEISLFKKFNPSCPNCVVIGYSCSHAKPVVWPKGVGSDAVLGSFDSIDIGPCLLSAWVDEQQKITVQYHSVDRLYEELDYSGWPQD
ncbi:MAG: hypothetical protein JXQ83_08505 [Candidatus Glassbacteria bacterium]|nr:hypothetical protein [Candidatus Glassbacteria bacterium]